MQLIGSKQLMCKLHNNYFMEIQKNKNKMPRQKFIEF